MGKIHIQIHDAEEEKDETITTEGCLILYLDNDKVRVTGKFDMKLLMPLLAKFMLGKMTK